MAMVISPRSKIVTLSLLIGIVTLVALIITGVIGIWHKSEKPTKPGTKAVSSKLQQITGYTVTKHVSTTLLLCRVITRLPTIFRGFSRQVALSNLLRYVTCTFTVFMTYCDLLLLQGGMCFIFEDGGRFLRNFCDEEKSFFFTLLANIWGLKFIY
ncbi:hypothetical protein WH47_05336 [Habropoda laboriosa]|uniref:Uncharacterized protein n=1 Tax=Habropoda laboriosa TaxID=597456 RepID=A0A0L7QUQ2_9HYME|nr:hypothetical protein WH47_05336 [Habropoda laboriosa]